jgi:GNAT superfamily N-acetyltransferase
MAKPCCAAARTLASSKHKKREKSRRPRTEYPSRRSLHPAQPFLPQPSDSLSVRWVGEYCASRDENTGARLGRMRCGSGCDSAIDLEVHGPTRAVDHVPYRANFRKDFGEEDLTAEAGVDAHHQHDVADVDDVTDGIFVRCRIEHDARALSEMANVLERPMQMWRGFDVNAEPVGTGLGEIIEVLLWLDDHQVNVDWQARCGTNRFHDRWPDGDVRDEAPIHDVDVNPVGSGELGRSNLFGEPTEISREDRRRDGQRAGRSHGVDTLRMRPRPSSSCCACLEKRGPWVVMNVRHIAKGDFDRVVEVIDHWWGGPISTFAHPIFYYELGEQALVVEQGADMIGFLLGFAAPGFERAEPHGAEAARTGYVHLVGIHPEYRRRGVGRLLYDRFTDSCRQAGCARMKAITAPGHEGSIRFHVALGWRMQEIDDYAGPGRRRIVFTKSLV